MIEEKKKEEEMSDEEFSANTKKFFKTFGRAFVAGAKITGNFMKRTYNDIKNDVMYKEELDKITIKFTLEGSNRTFLALDEEAINETILVIGEHVKIADAISVGTVIVHPNNNLRFEVVSFNFDEPIKRDLQIKEETVEITLFPIVVKAAI